MNDDKQPYLYPVFCCDRLVQTIDDDNMMCVQSSIAPFVPVGPRVWLQSDGGHGGMEDIDYCPFCGTKITFGDLLR